MEAINIKNSANISKDKNKLIILQQVKKHVLNAIFM